MEYIGARRAVQPPEGPKVIAAGGSPREGTGTWNSFESGANNQTVCFLRVISSTSCRSSDGINRSSGVRRFWKTSKMVHAISTPAVPRFCQE